MINYNIELKYTPSGAQKHQSVPKYLLLYINTTDKNKYNNQITVLFTLFTIISTIFLKIIIYI